MEVSEGGWSGDGTERNAEGVEWSPGAQIRRSSNPPDRSKRTGRAELEEEGEYEKRIIVNLQLKYLKINKKKGLK